MTEFPSKVYVVSGEPAAEYTPPAYSTDPRFYHLPDFDQLGDQEYEQVAAQLRAFPNEEDATTFMYACNLETVWCVAYRREAEGWLKDEEEMKHFMDNI